MNFSLPFFKKKKSSDNVYLGIFLKESEGIVFYLEIGTNGLEIKENERFIYTNGWENITDDIDDVLYRLEIKTGKTPDKTIFFVYSHFVDIHAKEIKRPYLVKIKELSKNLELRPLGYIECHEAILDYLQKKDSNKLTSILLEFDKHTIGIFIYQSGNLIWQETTSRSDDVISDLLPLFEKAKEKTVLPPRIVLYNSKDLDAETAGLMEHDWGSDMFVRAPKIEVVQEKDLIDSLVLVFSRQIDIQNIPVADLNEPSTDEHEQPQNQKLEQNDRLGFTIGNEDVVDEYESTPKRTKKFASFMTSVIGLVENIKMKFAKMAWFKSKSTVFSVAGLIGVVLIVIALVISEYYFHTATIKMTLPSQSINESLTINGQDLNLQTASDAATFDSTIKTTGTRQVGDKAKGSVTIYNSSLTDSKTYTKGTVLKASNGLGFTLDSDVKVASASGDASDISSSTAKANVTAQNIGPESNLQSGTKLSVADESSSMVIAKNDSAFSGGSKRSIQIVGQADITKLQQQIEAKAADNAKNNKMQNSSPDQVILDPLTSYKIISSDYSSKLGDEASSVTLKAGVETTFTLFNQTDMKNHLSDSLKNKIQSKYLLPLDKINYSVKNAVQNKKGVQITVDVRAKAIPPLATNTIVNLIKGKNKSDVLKLSKDSFSAQDVEIEIKDPLFFLNNWMPFFTKNIRVELLY